MDVLVTGSAGSIGAVVTAGLAGHGHRVRGLDLGDHDATHCALGVQVGDCSDPAVASRAVQGMQAVVHLAGRPTEGSLADELASHVTTTATLLDAMVEHRATRMVYASSNHAVGMHERRERLGIEVSPRPDTFYGVGKVAAEAVLSLYTDRHPTLSAVSLRIGSFLPAPESVRGLSTWLSHDDCVRLVQAALTAEVERHAVAYGISANTRAWWDLEPGRALGYHPVDDAEDYADRVPHDARDEVEAARVGGPYAAPEVTRGSR